MFKKFRQVHPFAMSLFLAAIPAAVMMVFFAFPMYQRWIAANVFGFVVTGGRRALHLAGEFALLWAMWTAFIHRGMSCAALFAFFAALEFAPAVFCHSPAGPLEFFYLCLFPAFWTLTACVLAIPARGRGAVWARRIWAVVPFFGVMQYLVNLSYVLKFGRQPGAETLMTILSTNFGEARDFLLDQIGLLPVAAGLVVICAACFALRALVRRVRPLRRLSVNVLLCALCLCAALFIRNQDRAIANKGLISAFRKSYRDYRSMFVTMRNARSDLSHQISNLNVKKDGTGEICVIVVGESATRRHMSRYGYDRPTTPWLCSDEENLRTSLFVLENAFSCMTYTVPAVTMALSQFSNYDKIGSAPEEIQEGRIAHPEAMKAFSLFEILKAAGVKTHWFSNQTKFSAFDTPISAQAYAADEQDFLEDLSSVDGKNGHQDEELLPLLDRVLASSFADENHVIFLHLRGSHWRYDEDAPADWPYLPPVNRGSVKREVADRIDAYDRSISYTDFVLSKIVETLAKSKFSVTSMLYFSDHGEDVAGGGGHNFDAFQPVMAEIPVVIWLSEGYRNRWPETTAQLRTNEKRIFTNDLVCELALGLNHVLCDNIVPERQLTSPRYGITVENARFWNGVLLSSVIPNLKD